MALFGSLSTVRSQVLHPAHFAASFAFVEETLREGSDARRQLFALAAGQSGRTELPGGAFALTQVYLTKPRSEGIWETHKAYIDVQVIIEGEELMEIADRAKLVVKEDLTPGKDVVFYQPFNEASVLRYGPGYTGVYFPPDAHMGNLFVKAPTLVRKVVVKVPALA